MVGESEAGRTTGSDGSGTPYGAQGFADTRIDVRRILEPFRRATVLSVRGSRGGGRRRIKGRKDLDQAIQSEAGRTTGSDGSGTPYGAQGFADTRIDVRRIALIESRSRSSLRRTQKTPSR
jgi:hypothetical protein